MNEIIPSTRITLCGSKRFRQWFEFYEHALTSVGHVVFQKALDPRYCVSEAQFREFNRAHLNKIKASDAILVLNVFSYIGEATLGHIEYARSQGKAVYFYEPWKKGDGPIPGRVSASVVTAKGLADIPQEFVSPVDASNDQGDWTKLMFTRVYNYDFPTWKLVMDQIASFKKEHESAS